MEFQLSQRSAGFYRDPDAVIINEVFTY